MEDVSTTACETVSLSDCDAFHRDVIEGLSEENKSLQCKYLYDEIGSKLFDAICELEEYYPTRTESRIMQENASEIGASIGSNAVVVEYGSGSSTKTRHLLDSLVRPEAYLPVDISEAHLINVVDGLREEYQDFSIEPIVADFTQAFSIPEEFDDLKKCVYFPGSTIGNLEPDDAIVLLRNIRNLCDDSEGEPNGSLLLGFDLIKDKHVLELAYDDPQGVTAQFNLNLLHRINRELGADFKVDKFEHVARYNETQYRIEIYIESLCEQEVCIGDDCFQFSAGERVHTEYSHKYTVDSMAELCAAAGFAKLNVWTDSRNYFAVMHLKAV